MKISICNELFVNWDFERIIKYIAMLGYNGIEIAPFTLCDNVKDFTLEQRRSIRRVAENYNIEIVGTHWLLVKPPGLHIFLPEARERTKDYLIELIKFTHDIGGSIMVFGSPKQRNIPKGISKEKAYEIAKRLFKECSRVAQEYDVTICIEPLSHDQTNFINNAKEAVKLIELVNEPNFKLILDVRSMFDEKEPHEKIIRKYGKYLAHFHANNDTGLGPGLGRARYEKIIKALLDIGYNGFLSVEVFDFSLGPRYIAERSIFYLRKYLGVMCY